MAKIKQIGDTHWAMLNSTAWLADGRCLEPGEWHQVTYEEAKYLEAHDSIVALRPTIPGLNAIAGEAPAASLVPSRRRGSYALRMGELEKIEKLMADRVKDRTNGRRILKTKAYSYRRLDYRTVKKYAPEIHAKWDDWDSRWEDDWKELVGWERLLKEAV